MSMTPKERECDPRVRPVVMRMHEEARTRGVRCDLCGGLHEAIDVGGVKILACPAVPESMGFIQSGGAIVKIENVGRTEMSLALGEAMDDPRTFEGIDDDD